MSSETDMKSDEWKRREKRLMALERGLSGSEENIELVINVWAKLLKEFGGIVNSNVWAMKVAEEKDRRFKEIKKFSDDVHAREIKKLEKCIEGWKKLVSTLEEEIKESKQYIRNWAFKEVIKYLEGEQKNNNIYRYSGEEQNNRTLDWLESKLERLGK